MIYRHAAQTWARLIRVAISPLVLTVPEVARVLSRLEPRAPVSEHQVRYLAAQGCLRPTAHRSRGFGDSALYGIEDVAIARTLLRLVAGGVPLWVAKAAIAYHEQGLRADWQTRRDVALVVKGVHAQSVLVSAAPKASFPTVIVRQSDVRQGLLAAMRAERERKPAVWAGWRSMPAHRATKLMEVSA